MSQTLVRNEDFKSGSLFSNIRGIIYQGNGSPVNRINASNAGALYIDNYTGQLWVSLNSGQPATWQPYFTEISTNVRIDSDVQEGDLVGIFGAGSWNASGNISVSKYGLGSFGSQNAGVIAGGTNNDIVTFNTSEIFNGSVWTASSNINVSRFDLAGCGGQNSGLVAGGITSTATGASDNFNGSTWSVIATLNTARSSLGVSGNPSAALSTGGINGATRLNTTELYNGSTWIASNNINISRQFFPSIGAQNASVITGGITPSSLSSTETFNGSTWNFSGNLINATDRMGGSGTLNAAIISNGNGLSAPSEIYNGSTWIANGFPSSIKIKTVMGGSVASSFLTGGGLGGSNLSNLTFLHNQNTYRKLTYNSIAGALNIGMAYNTSNTSLTASVMRGDLPSTYVLPNTWFGISRFNNVDNNCFVSSTTATISSISSTITNQAVLNLSASLTTGFAVGSLLLISNGLKVPIIGGTVSAPVVRWENVSTSASTSLTVSSLCGQRIIFNSMNIASSGTTATVTQTATLQFTQFYKGRVGDLLYIPYSSVSGTNGSSIFYGTYQITNVTYPATDIVAFTINLPQSVNNASENNIGSITVLKQILCKNNWSTEDIVVGYRNKMRHPMYPIQDDLSNGLI